MMYFQNIWLSILGMIIICTVYGNDYVRIRIPNPTPTIVLNTNVTLTCILPEPNVTQFIWWKEDKLEDKLERIVTYNLTSYENLTKETKDLELYDQRLTLAIDVPASSIIIHNVQLEDEDCYICSFKLYPQGKIHGRACLTVIGIVEMNIEKFSTQSEDIIIVRCSAVGKPDPMVTWKTSENVIEHKQERKVDDNGIVTVIGNVTVDLSTFQANEITCIASQAQQNGQKLEKTISLREDPMVTWKTSENVIEHKQERKVDDNGIVTVIGNVTVDLSTFQANEITCIAVLGHEDEQTLEKSIHLREVKNVRVTIAIGIIFATLLIIVTVITIRSGRISPAVCVASITSLSLSNLVHGAVSERQGPREGD
ncbi:UNVERIFIED_CONTAM: hypothetical protein FKN15_050987 [Acipenser sinensis]